MKTLKYAILSVIATIGAFFNDNEVKYHLLNFSAEIASFCIVIVFFPFTMVWAAGIVLWFTPVWWIALIIDLMAIVGLILNKVERNRYYIREVNVKPIGNVRKREFKLNAPYCKYTHIMKKNALKPTQW